MSITKSIIAVELGRRGGQKTLEKWGLKHYKRMAELAAKKRKKLYTDEDLTSKR